MHVSTAVAAEYYARGPPGRRCRCQCPVRWAVTSARDLVQWASSTSRRPRRRSSVPGPFTHPGDVFAIIAAATRRCRRRRRRELRREYTPHRLPPPPPPPPQPPTDRVALISDKTVALPASPRPSRSAVRKLDTWSVRCELRVHPPSVLCTRANVRSPRVSRTSAAASSRDYPVDFTIQTHIMTVCSMSVHRPHT